MNITQNFNQEKCLITYFTSYEKLLSRLLRKFFNAINNKCLFVLFLLNSSIGLSQISWNELTHDQQKLLLPFESKWQVMDSDSRQKLLENTNKWLQMSPLEKKEAGQKLRRFKQKPLAEQKRIQEKITRFKQMPPQQRKQLRNTHKRFQKLSPEQKRKIRTRYKNLPVEKRYKAIKRDIRKYNNRNFINEFDISKRQPMINMFQEFPKGMRAKLRRYYAQLSAKQRHNISLKLLEMMPNERIEYIKTLTVENKTK